MKPPPTSFIVFMAVWAVLMLFVAWFFGPRRDVALRRRVFPWWIIGSSVLFMGFVLAMTDWQLRSLPFAIPVAFIAFLNIRNTKFCSACGAMVYNRQVVAPMLRCPK
jgi:hypothetical protein